MRIDETAVYVNKRLKEGYSIAKVERELEYGKDTLRKKLNRANYFYHKDKNQFLIDNTDVTQSITQDKNVITHQSNTTTTHTDKPIEDRSLTHPVTQDLTQHNPSNNHDNKATQPKKEVITQEHNTKVTQPRAFTDEDFEIMFKLIDEYKSRVNIIEKPIELPKDDSDLTTRSFRSYKKVFESFSKYCKDNNLQQKDAVAEALLTFMKK